MSIKDKLWKGIVEELFEDFISFFMPDLYPEIDFDKGVEFLDKEFETLFPKSKETKRYVDKLIKVCLKDGTEQWLFIHVEIQGYKDADFTKRMFRYFYRIYDKYQKEITAIAIFTDSNKLLKPDRFEYSCYKTNLIYNYRTYKLLDQDEANIEKMTNPFALVVLAGLYSIKSKNKKDEKYRFKVKLIKLLIEKGYTKEKSKNIFIFMDGLLSLPKELELKFEKDVKKLTGRNKKMGLTAEMSTIGQIAYKKGEITGEKRGEKTGERKGLLEGIELALEIKFGAEGLALKDKINRIEDIKKIKLITKVIKIAKNADEIKATL